MVLLMMSMLISLPSKEASAISNFSNVYVEIVRETGGDIEGIVMQEITTYYFTMSVHKGLGNENHTIVAGIEPAYQSDYAASSEAKLKITYGVVDAEKKKSGVTAAEIVVN
jgi:hypothetical protein